MGSVIRYVFLGLLFLTWVFWNVAVFHCTFVNFGPERVDYKDRAETGIFTTPLYDGDDIYTCARFHPDAIDDFDAAQNAARFFGAFGYIMHTLAMFSAILVELFVHQRVALIWTITRVLIIISAVCSVLIFSIFGTEGCENDSSDFIEMKCAPGSGGIVAIFNIVFIIAVAALSWILQAPENPFFVIQRWKAEEETDSPTTKEDPQTMDPTQSMNDETQKNHLDEQHPEPPTMDYIETETETKELNPDLEAEA